MKSEEIKIMKSIWEKKTGRIVVITIRILNLWIKFIKYKPYSNSGFHLLLKDKGLSYKKRV